MVGNSENLLWKSGNFQQSNKIIAIKSITKNYNECLG